MPDDKYWQRRARVSLTQTGRQEKQQKLQYKRKSLSVVFFCRRRLEFHKRVIIRVKWQAADDKQRKQHISLLLVVLGQGFILFSGVILLFLPRKDEDSLSITLPASFLFFDCASSGGVLFPEVAVISLHLLFITPSSWACPALIFSSILWSLLITEVNHILWKWGAWLCRSQSVSASLLLLAMRSQSRVLVPASNYGLSVCLSLSFSYSYAQSPSFLSRSFASLRYFHCFAAFLWFGPPDFLCLSAFLSGECLTPLSGGMKLSEVVPEENAFSSSTHLCGYGVLTAWPTLVPRCSVNFDEELRDANKAAFQTHSSLHLSSHTTDRLIYNG